MSDDFDWDDESIVVAPEQEALAVYQNSKGAIVIRKRASWDENDDPFFLLQPAHAVQFAQAVLDAAEIGAWVATDRMARMMADRPDIDWAAVIRDFNESESRPANLRMSAKDKTGAARQRRYRERHRNGSDDRDVTRDDRDSVTPNRNAPLLIAAE